jgi:hypothetical protein
MARRIAFFLFAIYLLSYSGALHSTDAFASLAVTEQIASGRGLDTPLAIWQQYGAEYLAASHGVFDDAGHMYSKRSLFHSLLPLPLFALGGVDPALGRVHMAMLATALATALSGALVYLTGRKAGYGETPSVLAALAFGLATPAWPYARWLFSEPYIALGLAMAAYGIVRAREDDAPAWAALAGAGLGLGAGFNQGSLVAAPVVLWAVWAEGGRKWRWARLAALAIPLAAALAMIGGYNAARFGGLLDTGRDVGGGEWFGAPVQRTIPAILVSPARGVLWYAPLVWLGVAWGVRALLRRERPGRGAWYIAAVAAVYVVMYGSWYMWWGGYAWGPRYLAALTPLMALAALPALGRACARRGWQRAAVIGVVAAAVAVQALGVAVNFVGYENELRERFGISNETPLVYAHGREALYDVSLSPILGHARRLFERGANDVVWFAGGVDWPAVVVLGAVVVLMGYGLFRAMRTSPRPSVDWLTAALLVAVTGWAMARNGANPLEPNHLPDPALDLIAAEAEDGDGVLLYVPELTKAVLNSYPGFPPAWGMPPLVPPDDDLEAVLSRAQDESRRLWVVSWFDRTDPDAWLEARLAAEHFAVGGRRQAEAGGYWIGCYLLRRDDEQWQPAGWQLEDNVDLEAFAVAVGDELLVSTRWRARGPVAGDYVIFIHVLDSEGRVVAQSDHAPQNTFRPTWDWPEGEPVIDRAALPLDGLARGETYRVVVGMYDWREPAARLPGALPGGEQVDALTLLTFEW